MVNRLAFNMSVWRVTLTSLLSAAPADANPVIAPVAFKAELVSPLKPFDVLAKPVELTLTINEAVSDI
jgi:hypothetical protein